MTEIHKLISKIQPELVNNEYLDKAALHQYEKNQFNVLLANIQQPNDPYVQS